MAHSRRRTLLFGARLKNVIRFWLSLHFLSGKANVTNDLSSRIVNSLEIQHSWVLECARHSRGVLLPLCSLIWPILPKESVNRK